MGTKLTNRVWRMVDKATDRARGDGELLSSVNTKSRVDGSRARDEDTLAASSSLKLLKDYSNMYFSALLTELRPPKISSEDFVELVDRVEKLSRGALREPTGEQILALLDKYRVVVPKEVLMSLLKDGADPRRAANDGQQPEVPPKWSLLSCKGLHDTAALDSQVRYQKSLHYDLSKMHHNDLRIRRGLPILNSSPTRPGTKPPPSAAESYRPHTSLGITSATPGYGEFSYSEKSTPFMTQMSFSSNQHSEMMHLPTGAGGALNRVPIGTGGQLHQTPSSEMLRLPTPTMGAAHRLPSAGEQNQGSSRGASSRAASSLGSARGSLSAQAWVDEDDDDKPMTAGELRERVRSRRIAKTATEERGECSAPRASPLRSKAGRPPRRSCDHGGGLGSRSRLSISASIRQITPTRLRSTPRGRRPSLARRRPCTGPSTSSTSSGRASPWRKSTDPEAGSSLPRSGPGPLAPRRARLS
ncbi:hypothetical protein T484DRAFT_1886007 [Baffinella frigidus]|nr:hypothetical protein T484DRAFT_1886007 [Cryptophyta sp. CCMP2293]